MQQLIARNYKRPIKNQPSTSFRPGDTLRVQ